MGALPLEGATQKRMVAVTPAVQDLQGDAAAGSVDRSGHLAVLGRLDWIA